MAEPTWSIPQAAEILQVSTKTVRNYISKSFLKPQMWNGTWRISENEIREIFEKKFGKSFQRSENANGPSGGDYITISGREYGDLQQKAGRLSVEKEYVKELKQEFKTLSDRVVQLEASASAAWTETRTCKAETERLRAELRQTQEREKLLGEELNWLRRERERIEAAAAETGSELERLKKENAALAEQAHRSAIGI